MSQHVLPPLALKAKVGATNNALSYVVAEYEFPHHLADFWTLSAEDLINLPTTWDQRDLRCEALWWHPTTPGS